MNEPDFVQNPTTDVAGDRFADPLEARKKAMDYLARREHGRSELLDKLLRAGFGPETAAAAIGQLSREGLQDDARFVESFVQSRIRQGKGPVRIRLELGQRGIDPAIVEEQLAACGEDWQALARAIRLRKFGGELPGDFREKARQMRFLQYRGFEPEQVQAALLPAGDG